MNLLQETRKALSNHGKSPGDVKRVQGDMRWFTWDEFAAVADVTYDAGFGAAEVASDLKVVGDDWWLERAEHDGAEWWEFKCLPTQPDRHEPPTRVMGGMWCNLENQQKGRTVEAPK